MYIYIYLYIYIYILIMVFKRKHKDHFSSLQEQFSTFQHLNEHLSFNPCIFGKTSIIHQKFLTFRFVEDNDPITAKSVAHVLPLNLA